MGLDIRRIMNIRDANLKAMFSEIVHSTDWVHSLRTKTISKIQVFGWFNFRSCLEMQSKAWGSIEKDRMPMPNISVYSWVTFGSLFLNDMKEKPDVTQMMSSGWSFFCVVCSFPIIQITMVDPSAGRTMVPAGQ